MDPKERPLGHWGVGGGMVKEDLEALSILYSWLQRVTHPPAFPRSEAWGPPDPEFESPKLSFKGLTLSVKSVA